MRRTVAILELPGSNCERESAHAVELAGGSASIVRWNESPAKLADFGGYILPGGFSYQDRIRAGAVAARLPLLEVVSARAREGAPVLGICNGAQVLVESGLVPGFHEGVSEVVLAPNTMPGRDGYYSRWVLLGRGPAADRCLFTQGLGERVFAVPMAHGEGRFWTRDAAVASRLASHVALTYRAPNGSITSDFPWNPNGSMHAAAGVTNAAGNVLALMPHPERAVLRAQVPPFLAAGSAGDPEAPGPGLAIFQALVKAVSER
jgi:phosphoribosylformylglycinamidine synthase